MKPNAYHKTEDLNNDDDASLYGHRDSFTVEVRIDVLLDVNPMKENKVDIKLSQDCETSLILETSWYHVGQIGAEKDKDNEKHVG